jgi:hypothetical protein
MKTEERHGGFNVATLAVATRNGVTRACVGPSHTWHDDDACVTQRVEGAETETVKFSVQRYNIERQTAAELLPPNGKIVGREDFARFCEAAGLTYIRTVE